MKKVCLVLIVLLLSFKIVQAQNNLPTIVPPSPQSANFLKFGEFPVNYNTGIPDISIPLYTIKSGSLEMPVILRYHSAGIKVISPEISNIGAGWTLEVGGMISRSISGRADELFKKRSYQQLVMLSQYNADDINYLSTLTYGKPSADAQHDKFSYMFNGQYGNFVIDDNGTNTFTAYPYPFVPYKFNVQTVASADPDHYYQTILGIDITDDGGRQYQFGHNNISKGNIADDYATLSWYLEKVSDQQNASQINLSYVDIPPYNFNNTVFPSYVTTGPDNGTWLQGAGICNNGQAAPQTWNWALNIGSVISYATKAIDVITFQNGYVKFNYDSGNRYLNSLVIYNNNNAVIKSFVFNRDIFPGSTSQYRLNSLQVKDVLSSQTGQYGFTYNYVNDLQGNPLTDDNCEVDYWGYCKGQGTTALKAGFRTIDIIDPEYYLHNKVVHNVQIGNTDLTPNDAYSKRFLLQKIQYPTGGTSEFVYEGNVYADSYTGTRQVLPGGGLRIRQIISRDSLGGTVTKSYQYDPGFIEFSLANNYNFVKTSFNCIVQCSSWDYPSAQTFYQYRNRIYSNNVNADLGDNRVYYTGITEYTGDGSVNTGKTIYTYTYDNPNGIGSNQYYNSAIGDYRNWGNGLLREKQVFKNTGNNTYFRQKDVLNTYTFTDLQTFHDLSASILNTYTYAGANYIDPIQVYNIRNSMTSSGYAGAWALPNPCSTYFYAIHTGAYYLSSVQETDYSDNGGSLSTLTQYKHTNPQNYYTTEEDVSKSDGSIGISRNTYPQDLNDPVSAAMVAQNILSPVIVKKNYKSVNNTETLLSTLQTTYAQFGSLFAPSLVSTSRGGGALETRLLFNKYDTYGNTLEQQKAGSPKQAYQWGYNNAYPVASVINAPVNDIFYDSFEEGNGNSTDSRTGHYSHTGSYTKALSGLDAGSYTLNYWQKAQGVWSLVTTPVMVTGSTYSISLSAQIDDVRFYPSNSQMTTYTYDPLVGMTSATDAKGQTTYYEYDSFQRLTTVKDQNGKILKHTDYHYQGQ